MRSRGAILFLAGVVASMGLGWVVFPRVIHSSRTQPVDFSHTVHAQKAALECEDCHTLRGDGSYTGIPPLGQCAGCHPESLGPSEAEKDFVARYVTRKEQPEWASYARQPENVWFSHTPHVKAAEIACERCHGDHGALDRPRVFQKSRISGYSRDIWGYSASLLSRAQGAPGGGEFSVPGMKMDDCIDCHEEEGLEHSCLDCHQ